MYVDYRAAFDSLSHDYMCMSLVEHSLQEKLINVIMSVYGQAKVVVKGPNAISVHRGVLKGDSFRPHLFICALDSVFALCTEPDDGITLMCASNTLVTLMTSNN